MEILTRQILLPLGIFLLINFGGLALGGWLQGGGPSGEWYQSLNRAPWTPPGWVFGAAWTSIMACFSIYMAYLYRDNWSGGVLGLFVAAFLLNLIWNPVFFRFRQVEAGLVILIALLVVIGALLIGQWKGMSWKSLLLLPYVIWLVIAISLNGFVLFENELG